MKRILIICLFVFYFCSCSNNYHIDNNQIDNNDSTYVDPVKVAEQESAQNYYNMYMRHNRIKDENGHDIIFHESGNRGYRNYSFSIEHAMDCQKCYDVFD